MYLGMMGERCQPVKKGAGPSCQSEIISDSLRPMIKEQVGKSAWSIYKHQKHVQALTKTIDSMNIATVQTLSFTGYRNPLVLRMISHIQFPCLTALYLYENQIVSLEALIHLKAPALRQLRFGDNFIAEMRSLRRVCIPSLVDLRFHRNNINRLDFLSQMQCHSIIKHLTLESMDSDPCTGQDMSSMAKGISKSKQIECHSIKRVAWHKLKSLFCKAIDSRGISLI